jgi:hypothetical protein
VNASLSSAPFVVLSGLLRGTTLLRRIVIVMSTMCLFTNRAHAQSVVVTVDGTQYEIRTFSGPIAMGYGANANTPGVCSSYTTPDCNNWPFINSAFMPWRAAPATPFDNNTGSSTQDQNSPISATAFAAAVRYSLGAGVLFPADFVNWNGRSYYWNGTGVSSTVQYNNTWLTYACVGCRTSSLLGQAEAIPANEAPTDAGLSPSSIAENAGVNATVGTFSSVDAVGDTFTYALVAGTGSTDNTLFTISGGTLRANAPFDFETQSSFSIRVRSADQGGLFVERGFIITVTNVNEAPTDLSLSFSTVVENCLVGQPVGGLATTDPDAAETFTYSIVPGADGASFRISGSVLEVSGPIDFEAGATRNLTIRATDRGGLIIEKQFTITVIDVSEGADAGSIDAGFIDGGSIDGGLTDSGLTDGGLTDGGSIDGGSIDGGSIDGGSIDGGSIDGGSIDGGSGSGGSYAVGCDCSSADQLSPWLMMVLLYAARRARPR